MRLRGHHNVFVPYKALKSAAVEVGFSRWLHRRSFALDSDRLVVRRIFRYSARALGGTVLTINSTHGKFAVRAFLQSQHGEAFFLESLQWAMLGGKATAGVKDPEKAQRILDGLTGAWAH